MKRLLLASSSPRRASLLRYAGLPFTVRSADIDESWHEGEHPVDYTKRVALEKLKATPRDPDQCRLAADTSVWLEPGSPPLGKPASRDEAANMLKRLSRAGQHHVTTAFALDAADGPRVESVTTIVHMRDIAEAELEAYLDGGDWGDKAGGYGIQARAAAFIPRVDGSYTNVVGLPVFEVLAALAKQGIRPGGPTT